MNADHGTSGKREPDVGVRYGAIARGSDGSQLVDQMAGAAKVSASASVMATPLNTRRDRLAMTSSWTAMKRDANQLEHVNGEQRPPCRVGCAGHGAERCHWYAHRVSQCNEQRKAPEAPEQGARRGQVGRPMACGGHAERKTGEQQEQARRQAALELPHVEDNARLECRGEQRIDRVAVEHEDDGDPRARSSSPARAMVSWRSRCAPRPQRH